MAHVGQKTAFGQAGFQCLVAGLAKFFGLFLEQVLLPVQFLEQRTENQGGPGGDP